MALRHLRDTGILIRGQEWAAEAEANLRYEGPSGITPLYPA